MNKLQAALPSSCDVIVAGAGAAGLTAAIVAKKRGLDVIVVEKASQVGGTTAFAGGFLWIPNNHLMEHEGLRDSPEDARRYLHAELGAHYEPDLIDAFLENGPRMVRWLEEHSAVKFNSAPRFADYHPQLPGGMAGGRAIVATPLDGSSLGAEFARLRRPLKAITFMGMMFNSGVEIQHFFNVTRSFRSASYVARRVLFHAYSLARYRRGVRLTSGNALAGRLFKSALDLGIPIYTDCRLSRLLTEEGKVSGVVVKDVRRVTATRGVILATGGLTWDRGRRRAQFPHEVRGQTHHSLAPIEVAGDGIHAAEEVGAAFVTLPNMAAWIPVSRVPLSAVETVSFPHLIDRYKPGIIAVDRDGRRFVNEANSYHDVAEAMIARAADEPDAAAWLVCDHRTLRRYGMGHVKPVPLPIGGYLRSGYLCRGATLAKLAERTGIAPRGLLATVERFNEFARSGKDPDFRRGETAYNRGFGDPNHTPNPCLGPIEAGPFYAIRLYVGDLSGFDGIRTNASAQPLDATGRPLAGLFVVGADAASIMGGTYPAGGINLGPFMTFGFIAGEKVGTC